MVVHPNTVLKVAAEDSVLVMTLTRPEVRNAINSELAEALGEALDGLDRDPDLRSGIITGHGGHFCSGFDLNDLSESDGGHAGLWRALRHGSVKPLVAAVEGWAVGAGFELVLACDICVAASDARFALPEVRRGLVPAGGAVARLPRRIAEQAALEIILTGSPVGARRAHELGLVNVVSPPGGALPTAREIAMRIARNAPMAIRAAKAAVREQWSWDEETAWTRQMEIGSQMMASDDAREGAEAFLARRDPRWRDR